MYAQTFITIPLKKNSFPVAAENEHKNMRDFNLLLKAIDSDIVLKRVEQD